jgi:hypothetical protein
MEQFKKRLIAHCRFLILELCRTFVFVFPFYDGGTYDKVTTALRFCFGSGFCFAFKYISGAQ